MVDDAANAAQREALIALAQHQGGKLLENIARVDYVPVVLDVPQNPRRPCACVPGIWRPSSPARLIITTTFAEMRSNFYPPLTNVENATSAVALTDEFRGDGLGSQWSVHGRRSAYVASSVKAMTRFRRSPESRRCTSTTVL